ncbi:cyclic peptide export ABC transporter [Marilutibacter spongiae]|uniref:Cyclic peptide export ABC transporter n=1 Tax=Marilutibacter spongiae TaxID=2025720 RepID=A0A7W3Y5V7_9GAMM|nr:cyclic peptide export ABC transporter [Lysobacter spongiae]MBB1060449.1 cyclic peptide export ABC transporter [Lysobacter spongiae]
MNMFGAFSAKAPNRMFAALLLGAIAGIAYAGIIPLVLAALADPGAFPGVRDNKAYVLGWEISNFGFAASFLGLCVLILLARTASQVILIRLSLDVSTDMRRRLYERVSSAPIAELEKVGMPRLVAAITSDVPMVVAGARLLPDLFTNMVTLVGMLGYLLYLNAPVFWFVMGCIGFGVVTYQVPALIARRYLVRARNHLDGLHESIRGLVHGAKELKLNDARREDYFRRVLAEAEHRVRDDGKTGQTVMRIAQNYGDLITFFVIGATAFVFVNYHAISRPELVGVIMALLYVTGPIAILLNFIPQIMMARIALRKLNALFARIPEEAVARDVAPRRDWQAMRFEGVGYRYLDDAGEAGFEIGPLDLEIRKGEITFIVGGNGSGKSTLAKLVTMHYQRLDGEVRFDDEVLGPANIAGFRQGVSAIFSDYFLFDRVLGREGAELKDEVDSHLVALGLAGKVEYRDGRFTTLALSDGQKRRLALVAAYLEDAELYLFDEWAADQDPAFKAFFYNAILPGLKERGKAVVVISHDDRYFDVADQLVVMEDGRITDRNLSGATLARARQVASQQHDHGRRVAPGPRPVDATVA